jgi:hypothetical protein
MKTVTITIGKGLDRIITDGKSSVIETFKMNDFAKAINGHSEITFNGLCSQSKINKYETLLKESGFNKIATNWERVEDFGLENNPVHFSYTYSL